MEAPEPITLHSVIMDDEVQTFIAKADHNLEYLGYTDHGVRHCSIVAGTAREVLQRLGKPAREAELAAIAGYLHDIGNVVSRTEHGIVAALLAHRILERLGMAPADTVEVMCAIGNHEEEYGQPVSDVAAALILADKSDVGESRVRVNADIAADIHDRVNTACKHSHLLIDAHDHTITLELEIDTKVAAVMEYFEIFLDRMVMCRKAAALLGCRFGLSVNGLQLG